VFDFVDGGSFDEITTRRNRQAFEDMELRPHVLAGLADVDVSTSVLGQPLAIPVMASPTGLTGLVHPEGEAGVARGLHAAGSIYVLSASASYSLEEVASGAPGPNWFQLYMWRDRGFVAELLQRAQASGYRALVITVDVPMAGSRERDIRNGFSVPPRVTAKALAQGLTHPRWSTGFLRTPHMTFGNTAGRPVPEGTGLTPTEYVNSLFDPTVGWDDVERIRGLWNGPLVIKGIMRADDAVRAVRAGADAVIVSNHGGRQLDTAWASVSALPSVVEAVGQQTEVYLDSGVRRGTDVLKALALGANACLVGRPPVYGLAAGGTAGVARVMEILAKELRVAMTLSGCASVADITGDLLVAEQMTELMSRQQ
jgi:L-lactate dehydrogenase (cytochrome)